ncbi:MAG: L,D-transpeptidase family protein [Streptomyces sp.]|uniref:L,D-transpeptidase family protein n=1 Tax=Streptomyces sp. TaxID=1931 RepID=UPI003D6C2B0D
MASAGLRGTRTRGGALAMAAALLVGAGAASGCTAHVTNGGAPVRVSKMNVPTPTSPPSQADRPAARQDSPDTADPKPPAQQRTAAADPVVLAVGAQSAKVRELQARLRALDLFDRNPTGYYGPVTAASVSGFQRRQGMNPSGTVTSREWSALTARTHRPTRNELYPPTTLPLADPDPRCLTGRALCVSKKSRTLAWVVDGKVRSAMDVRFGSAYTPTREGEFSVDFKSRDHVSTIYDTPMPYALFFSGGQAIHYSSDFAARGYRGASHGCVNVRDKKKIRALFAQVRKGDKVVVYK